MDLFYRALHSWFGQALAALFLGCVLSWAMPSTLMVWNFLLVIPAYYALLLNVKGPGGAALCGWAFGFGFHVCGLYWIGNALLVDDNPYAWVYPLALVGLPAALALFDAACAALARAFGALDSAAGLLRFPALLAVSEYARGHLLTGFPWNLAGYAWSDHLPMLQMAGVGGVYFLGLLTFTVAASPACLLIHGMPARARLFVLAGAAGVLAACYALGWGHLAANPPRSDPASQIVIIQPNIKQADKWNADLYPEHLARQAQLSHPRHHETGGRSGYQASLIVWPEAALPLAYTASADLPAYLAAFLNAYGHPAYLVAGGIRDAGTGPANSALLYGAGGQLLSFYDKHHLVPFGEYIPFQSAIPFKPVAQFSGLEAGPGPALLDAGGIKVAPMICYEGIFPGNVVPAGAVSGGARADLLLSMTNDAWYGDTAGPVQHFLQTRLRAVEEGIPLVRTAQTGISGLIDAQGRIVAQAPLNGDTRIAELRPLPSQAPPLYARVRDALFWAAVAIMMGVSFLWAGLWPRQAVRTVKMYTE